MREKHKMKTVVSSNMVAHLWAGQSQPEARNQKGSLFFRDSTIYSYGSHFPIARHVKNKRGESAVLFTTRSYSATTAHHVSMVRGSASHLTGFFTDDFASHDYKAGMGYYAGEVEKLLSEASRARSNREWKIDHAKQMVEQANAYAAFFGIRRRLVMPTDIPAFLGAVKKRSEAAERKEQKRRAEAERKRHAKDISCLIGKNFGGGILSTVDVETENH